MKKIILEKDKRTYLCFEQFGHIDMFIVEEIKESGKSDIGLESFVYARLKKITYQDIEAGEVILSKIKKCDVI